MNDPSHSINFDGGVQSDRPMWNINPHNEERSFSRNFNRDVRDTSQVN